QYVLLRCHISCYRQHRHPHSFPTRRSSDLITVEGQACKKKGQAPGSGLRARSSRKERSSPAACILSRMKTLFLVGFVSFIGLVGDRKSTRLNSSHQIISYAVFCLNKKNN